MQIFFCRIYLLAVKRIMQALMIKQSAGRCFNWVYLLNTATLTSMTIKRVSNLNEYVTRRLGKEMWINDEEREKSQ